MAKHFVITGMRRSGTTFLSKFLNEHPDGLVQHEQPTSSWPKRFQAWVDADAKVVGMVDSNARFYMKEIEGAVHPLWGFLLREPVSLVRSCVAKKPGNRRWALDSAIRWTVIETFGGLEAALLMAQQLNIEMRLWRFDEIITPVGFSALSTWCGLDFDTDPLPTLRRVHETKDSQEYPPATSWPADLVDYVLDTANNFPLLSSAYAEVGIDPHDWSSDPAAPTEAIPAAVRVRTIDVENKKLVVYITGGGLSAETVEYKITGSRFDAVLARAGDEALPLLAALEKIALTEAEAEGIVPTDS